MSNYTTVTESASDVASFLTREVSAAVLAMDDYGSQTTGALRPLHELQRWCDMVMTQVPPTSGILPLYTLSRFLDDALDNLTGDFYYDEHTDRLRRDFFQGLVPQLKVLSESDLAGSSASWMHTLERMIEQYLRVISELDSYASTHVPRQGEESRD